MLPKLRRFLSKLKLPQSHKKDNPPLPVPYLLTAPVTHDIRNIGPEPSSDIVNNQAPLAAASPSTQRTAHDAIEISSLSAWILNGEVQRESERAFTGGGKSDIWQGIWKGEKVALKVLRDVRSDDQAVQRHLIRVTHAWSELNHRNVLRFYGLTTDIGVHITIVCPWFDNGNVLDYIRHDPDTNRMHLLLGAAEGLEYLHSQEVIHQNVKCHNILVSDSGDACICDFNLAQVYDDGDNYRTSSSAGGVAGEMRWLAPEIIDGSRETKKSDVYSFGMAILELLTGERPFAELKTGASVIMAITRSAQPKRPGDPAVRRWLTDGMWVLLERCWSKDPSSRPSMGDIVANLRETE